MTTTTQNKPIGGGNTPTKNKINMKNLNEYISKRHISMVNKLNDDLKAFAKETGEAVAELYEDAFTHFTLSNVRVEDGCLVYDYDGKESREEVVQYDEEEDTYYELQGIDGIAESVKFWRQCLRRAKRYWETDTDTLDKMSDGEIEDID